MSSSPENCHPFHPPRRLLLKACASGVLFGAAGFGTAAWAQPPLALSTAINRAGRLRALSQRMSKAYAQVTLDVLPERSLEVITLGQNLVRTSLVELGSAGFPAEISALLTVCRTDSEHLLSLVTSAPAAAHLGDINKVADQMLASADRLTGRLEGSGKAGAKILNIAGRQRMLSQRIAKCFMLIEAGQDPAVLSKQLETARSEFDLALDALDAAPVSNKAIKDNLALARMQWMFFQSALNGKDKSAARRDVATTSERVLEVMDSLTGLYDAALKELLGSVAYNDTQYAGLWQPAG